MKKGIVWYVFGIMLIPTAIPCSASEDQDLHRLLESLTAYEERCESAIHRVVGKTGPPSIVVKQPRHQNYVVVLVHDVARQGDDWVEVELFEGHMADISKSTDITWHSRPETWKLVELSPNVGLSGATGIFSAKLRVRGPHGTWVKVKYSTSNSEDTGSLTLESEPTAMSFH